MCTNVVLEKIVKEKKRKIMFVLILFVLENVIQIYENKSINQITLRVVL